MAGQAVRAAKLGQVDFTAYNAKNAKGGARLLTSRFNFQLSTLNAQPTIDFFLPKPVCRGKIASWLGCHCPKHR
jgi:hypothetical protein